MAITNAEKSARYRAKDVEAYRARKALYARSPEQRAIRTEYMKKWRDENRVRYNEICNESHRRTKLSRTPQERHHQHLVSWYGITRAEYLQMLEEQNGCGICGGEPSESTKSFHVDHCHETNKVRGILCNRCNTALGWFEKNAPQILAYVTQDLTSNKEVRTPAKSAAKRRSK